MTAVSEHALIQRINRKLAHDGQISKITRSDRAERGLGRCFILGAHRNLVVDRDISLKDLGRELGVLHPTRWSLVPSTLCMSWASRKLPAQAGKGARR